MGAGLGQGFVSSIIDQITAGQMALEDMVRVYQLIIHSNAPIEDILADFDMMEAMELP